MHAQTNDAKADLSALGMKRAFERALTALREYRGLLDMVANDADRRYAVNDCDEFDEVITDIRTIAEDAQEREAA